MAFSVFLGIAIGTTDAMTYQVLKPSFDRLRPCYLEPEATRLVVESCGSDLGFPSNHAANAMAAAVAGALTWRRRRLNIFLFGTASLVGLSRIYLGVHFPGDVLGGFVVGALISLALWWPWTRALGRYFPRGLPGPSDQAAAPLTARP
jgi:undecaprenyl-diphosphatase